MVLLITTPQILAAISDLPSLTSSLPISDAQLPTSVGAPISHTTLIAISRLSKSRSSTTVPHQYSLNTLLRNAHPYIPPPPPPPAKSSEYLALMARLRADQEAREYRSLISKSINQPPSQISIGDPTATEEKDDITPSLVVNILVSILCVAASSWYMTRWWRSDGVRVLVALLVAVVVGVAEVTAYAGYLRKVRLSREKERGLRERKVLVSSEEVVAGEGDKMSEEKETEAIWGRGKQGGMRRRVKEKWEREREQEGGLE